MKWIVTVVVLLAALFFYPQLNESANTSCAATETRFARAAFDPKEGASVLGALLASGVSNGALAREFAKSHYPNIPAAMGCAVVYYQMMTDPEMPKRAMEGL